MVVRSGTSSTWAVRVSGSSRLGGAGGGGTSMMSYLSVTVPPTVAPGSENTRLRLLSTSSRYAPEAASRG